MADFTFTIEETVGTLSTNAKGWKKELNKVSWGGRPPKYDIRDWSPEHDKMSKGVTLSDEEVVELKKLLEQLTFP